MNNLNEGMSTENFGDSRVSAALVSWIIRELALGCIYQQCKGDEKRIHLQFHWCRLRKDIVGPIQDW